MNPLIKHILAYLLIGSSVLMFLTWLAAVNMASRPVHVSEVVGPILFCALVCLVGALLL